MKPIDREQQIIGATTEFKQFLLTEYDEEHPDSVVRLAIEEYLRSRCENLAEELEETIVNRHLAEHEKLIKVLRRTADNAHKKENLALSKEMVSTFQPRLPYDEDIPSTDKFLNTPSNKEPLYIQQTLGFGNEATFSGNISYSKEKFEAMLQYLTSKDHDVYLTNLNKLLFYSDMTMYYLTDQGISGTIYLNRPFGPVTDSADPTINDLRFKGNLQIDDYQDRPNKIKYNNNGKKAKDVLGKQTLTLLDWVLDNYGFMTSGEISDYSHKETAYINTKPNEPISYEYAKHFRLLPPKDLLKGKMNKK